MAQAELDLIINVKGEENLAKVRKTLDETQKEARELGGSIDKAFDGNRATDFERDVNKATSTIQNQTKELNKLNNRLDELRTAKKNATDTRDFIRLNDEIKQTRLSIISVAKELVSNKTRSSINSFRDSFKNALSKGQEDLSDFIDSFGDVRTAITGIFTGSGNLSDNLSTLGTSISGVTRAGLAFIATPIGATIAALSAIGLATKEWYDYNDAITESIKLTEEITKLQGQQADDVRILSEVISDSFGKDQKEILEAARGQVNAFGISYVEALNVIKGALIGGANSNSEYLDSLREFPTFFAQAGFSFQEFSDIVNAGVDLGIFSDKLPDAIKEFNLSITEQTTATKEALSNAFGSTFTDELLSGVNSGSITVKEALASIAEESNKLTLTQQQSAQLTADVFRGAGEDVGGFLKVIEAVNVGLNQEVRELTELQKVTQDAVDAQIELATAKDDALRSDSFLAFRQSFVNIWTSVQIFFFQSLAGLRIAYEEFIITIKTQFAQIQAIGSAFSDLFSLLQSGFSTIASSANSLGDIFIDLVNFRNPSESFNNFSNIVTKGFEDIANGAELFKRNIIEAGQIAESEARSTLETQRKVLAEQNKILSQNPLSPPIVPKAPSKEDVNKLVSDLKKEVDKALSDSPIKGSELFDTSTNDNGLGGNIEFISDEDLEEARDKRTAFEKLLSGITESIGDFFSKNRKLIDSGATIGKGFLDAYSVGLDNAISKNEEFLSSLETTIQGLQKGVDKEKSLAEQGFANDQAIAEKRLAAAQEQQRKAQQQQEEAVRKQQTLDNIAAKGNLAIAISGALRSAFTGPNAAVGALVAGVSIAAILALFEKSVTKANTISFYDGTENTGKGGKVDSKGGFNAILHPNERVVPAKDNKYLSGIKNSELPAMAAMYKQSKIRPNYDYMDGLKVSNNEITNLIALGKMESLMRNNTNELRNVNRSISGSKTLSIKGSKVITTKGNRTVING